MCANHREMWADYRLRKSAKTENHCKSEPYQYFTRLRLNVLLLQKQKAVFWNHNSEIKKKKSSQHSSMPRAEGRPPNPLFVCIWVTCQDCVCWQSVSLDKGAIIMGKCLVYTLPTIHEQIVPEPVGIHSGLSFLAWLRPRTHQQWPHPPLSSFLTPEGKRKNCLQSFS